MILGLKTDETVKAILDEMNNQIALKPIGYKKKDDSY